MYGKEAKLGCLSIVTRLDDMIFESRRNQVFFFSHQKVQTGSGANPGPHSVGTWLYSPRRQSGRCVMLSTNFCLGFVEQIGTTLSESS